MPRPLRAVPVSTEQAGSLFQKLSAGLAPDPEGWFILRISEGELTSFVALHMQQSITDPQIILSNGKAYLYGTLASPVEAPLAATCSIETEGGRLRLNVEAATAAGFPIPQSLVESFTQQFVGLIASAQRQQQADIVGVEITEGELVIRGRLLL